MNTSITFISSSLRGGGAEKVSVNLANSFSNKGYKINFVVLNLINAVHQGSLDKNIKLTNLNVNHARTSFSSILKYCFDNKPQIILTFTHEIAIVLVLLRTITRLDFKLVARNISTLSKRKEFEKSFWHKHVKDRIIKILYKFIDHLIVQSKQMKEDMVENYNFNPTKISVINNPLTPEFESIAKSNNYDCTKKNELLFVGRLSKPKGLFYLLDGFKNILKHQPDLKLRIIGKGELETDLKKYVANTGLNNNVFFNGFKHELIPYYSQAKITLLTSLYEGFPNVLLESTAVGTPVVSFDCSSGPREIICNSANGFLVRYKDIDHLTETILKALKYDWDFRVIRKTALRYSSEKIFKQYLNTLI